MERRATFASVEGTDGTRSGRVRQIRLELVIGVDEFSASGDIVLVNLSYCGMCWLAGESEVKKKGGRKTELEMDKSHLPWVTPSMQMEHLSSPVKVLRVTRDRFSATRSS